MVRKKITGDVRAEVSYKSNLECCVCNKRGDHIHHLNDNNSDNRIENLALLCFDCHSEASMKGGLRKKLSAKEIIRFRDHKYKVVDNQRKNSLKIFSSPIKGLTTEDILITTKNAVIIIELEKIAEEYFSAEWSDRSDIIGKLRKYSDHTNPRLAVEIFFFLSAAADQTGSGMTSDVAFSIFNSILNFFPFLEKNNSKKLIELCDQCANIAFSICYDATIYLKKYEVAEYGLIILKYIYKQGKREKLKLIIDKVNSVYDTLELTLQRQERTDLGDALELVRIFRKDIEKGGLMLPILSENLMKIIDIEKKNNQFKK